MPKQATSNLTGMRAFFARYMVVKDPNKAHAKLSASGSERWLGCPGQPKLSDGIPSIDSPAGIRGTNTHTLLQFILDNYRNWRKYLSTEGGEEFLEFIKYDRAMLTNALFAAEHVWKEIDTIKQKSGRHVELFVERKVELSGVGFGTSDIVLWQPYGPLKVMDYKNGVKEVEPKGNTQGLYYMVASADEFNWEFSSAEISIIQPNASHKKGHIRTWEPTHKEIEQGGLKLRRGAEMTKKKDAPLVKNDSWCFFCPAKFNCPLQIEHKAKKLFDRFEVLG